MVSIDGLRCYLPMIRCFWIHHLRRKRMMKRNCRLNSWMKMSWTGLSRMRNCCYCYFHSNTTNSIGWSVAYRFSTRHCPYHCVWFAVVCRSVWWLKCQWADCS